MPIVRPVAVRQVIHSFDELPDHPMAFTLGTFDGVHLGHQAIFSKLRSFGVPTCAITFKHHPLRLLRPNQAPLEITPLPLKLLLLKTDFCLLLDFTPELASLTYEEFLNRLPISHLVLGKGSFLGREKKGTEPVLRAWGAAKGVHVDYIEKLPGISSTEIRHAIQRADFAAAETMLGRPHLLLAPSQTFSAEGLALPPDGSYPLYQNTALIKERTIHLAKPVAKPTILSFNPNKEFHV